MVNLMVESGGAHPGVARTARRYAERFRVAASAALRRAAAGGEIAPRDVTPKVDLLLGMILGLNVAARSGVPGLAAQLIEAMRAQVEAWRGGPPTGAPITRAEPTG